MRCQWFLWLLSYQHFLVSFFNVAIQNEQESELKPWQVWCLSTSEGLWDWFSFPIAQLQLPEVSRGKPRFTGRPCSQASPAQRAVPRPAQHSTGSSRSRADVKHRSAGRAGSCQLNLLEQSWNRNKPWRKQLNYFFFFFNLSPFLDCFKKKKKERQRVHFPAHFITSHSQVYSQVTPSVTKGEGTICHMC